MQSHSIVNYELDLHLVLACKRDYLLIESLVCTLVLPVNAFSVTAIFLLLLEGL